MAPQIGFSTNVFDNPPDIVDSIRKISTDFSCIELELGDAAERTVYEATPERYAELVRELRELIREKNLRLSIHAPYIGVTGNLAAVDEIKRRQSIERLERAIVFASDIDVKLVTCHPGLRLKQAQDVLLERLRLSLVEVVAFAKARGVELCVENMGNERPNYIVMSPDEQIEMCEATGAGITLDLIHLISVQGAGPQTEADLARLCPYIKNMHIADMVVPKHVHIPIGQGDLPLERCLKVLAANGYRGAAIVEEFGGPFETEMFYRHARAFRHYMETGAV